MGATLLLLLFLPGAGCARFAQEPTVRIEEVRVASLGVAGGTATVGLEIENPNRFAIDIRGLRYRLEVAAPESTPEDPRWLPLAADDRVEPRVLPGRETSRIELPVDFGYAALGAALRSLALSGTVEYRVTGELRLGGPFGGRTLPFSSIGEFGS